MNKPKFFYGYWILLSTFLFCMIAMGFSSNTFSIFIRELEEDLLWNRTQIMAAFTFFLLTAAIMSPVAGRLVDRMDAKKIIFTGGIGISAGLILLSQLTTLWQLYMGYTLVGIGAAMIGPVTSSLLISKWFKKKRGMAIGIMSMGMSTSGVVFAPIVAVFMIPLLGWRGAYLAMAIINLAIIIPCALFVVKGSPYEMGLYPDGVFPSQDTAENSKQHPKKAFYTGPEISLDKALQTAAFWMIGISLLFNHTHLGIYLNLYPHLRDVGFQVGIAASAISVASALSITGQFVFGWVCDLIKPKYASAIGLGFIAVGTSIFAIIDSHSPVWLVWIMAALFGFGMGSWLPTMSLLTSTTFGLISYGAIFGIMSVFQNVGAGAGPLIAGYVYDTTQSYQATAVITLGFIILFAIPLVLSVKPVKVSDQHEPNRE